ncbi:RHTO0S05e03708g1_1 [Rhodotorula toruloides]|uniref:RHTO0S05e03708g1_1 n=2 Tax=Rhodotorula toruloides TaxID=5286 RepID=A0A061AS35_RHOTO|nr:uncharacterized protein RHTO_07048 [Rhodotorula toruloides NP11]EMS23989.1 hypothetical protein RHTO_07048 [Rhodotorula toruloides NP11]CDR40453.1 RHTO0S05e03708g1_1 [Rhodotorula toruloides]
MAGMLNLPCELLIQIFRDLGADLKVYSAKERQTDLARLATVCRAFHAATVPLLYGDAVTCRSAGRTYLLDRSLLANPDLRPLVRTLVMKSELDNGHVSSLTSVLRHTPSLESLALASCFFEGDSGFSPLFPTLLSATHIQHFAYGSGSRLDRLVAAQRILPRWTQLRSLRLHRVDPQDLALVHPAPTYRLEEFSLDNSGALLPENAHSCSLNDLLWLVGSPGALESFSLVHLALHSDALKLVTRLVEQGHATTLSRLTLLGIRPTLPLVERTLLDPNDLAPLFPRLAYLELADYNHNFGVHIEHPHLHFAIPSTLRTLVLHDPLDQHFYLPQSLARQRPTNLRNVKIIGAYPTASHSRRLQSLCHDLGIAFEVERNF